MTNLEKIKDYERCIEIDNNVIEENTKKIKDCTNHIIILSALSTILIFLSIFLVIIPVLAIGFLFYKIRKLKIERKTAQDFRTFNIMKKNELISEY